jgi:DNA-binding NtrC family response regulator
LQWEQIIMASEKDQPDNLTASWPIIDGALPGSWDNGIDGESAASGDPLVQQFDRAIARVVGRSGSLLNILKQLRVIAGGDAAVVVQGETGTGKELIARAIHYGSGRGRGPFVPVNCGSLPDTLLEDELFGHERGAFTDARTCRPGLIQAANCGTLFLDEVDSLSPRAQAALLRVLQEMRFRPLGANSERPVDVRILAATNCCLTSRVREGQFRPDLYYRLSVFTIRVPALRERRDDIPLLAEHFLAKHVQPRRSLRLSAAALQSMLQFDWPGNVRELESAIIRATRLCRGDSIQPEDLELPGGPMPPTQPAPQKGVPEKTDPGAPPINSDLFLRSFSAAKREIVAAFEKDYLTRLMRRHQGNISRAAAGAGKERRDLGRLLKKHGLDAGAIAGLSKQARSAS